MGSRLTTEEFIKRAVEVNGTEKFDYSTVVYTHSRAKVAIFCRKHSQWFHIRAESHLKGTGCAACKKENTYYPPTKRKETFVAEANLVHGEGRYLYDLVDYVNTNTKVKIFCTTHNHIFEQEPANHLNGAGCDKCRLDSISKANRSDQNHFLRKAQEIHGDRYDYSVSVYKTSKSKIDIICKEHGLFSTRADVHLMGFNCPECGTTGFDTRKRGKVYILSSPQMFKVGITNGVPQTRVDKINQSSPERFSAVFYKEMDGQCANAVETMLLRWLKSEGLSQPTEKFDGYTECFYREDIPICSLIQKLEKFEQVVVNKNV